MAEEKTVKVEKPEVKQGEFDITQGVTVYATDKAPYHREGSEVLASQYVADKMILKGWATKDKPKAK